MKKIVSFLLATTMLISCIGFTAFADETTTSTQTDSSEEIIDDLDDIIDETDGMTAVPNLSEEPVKIVEETQAPTETAIPTAIPTSMQQEDEDDFQTESTKTIALNTDVSGSLPTWDDIYYYKFTLSKPGKVTVNFKHDLISSTDCFWQLRLFEEDLVTQVGNGGWTWEVQGNIIDNSFPSVGLKAGTYYVSVYHHDSFYEQQRRHSDANYTIRVDYTQSAVWEKERNDGLESATVVKLNTKYYGTIHEYDDCDWYKFTLDSDGKVQIHFSHELVSSVDPYWKLFLFQWDGVSGAIDGTGGNMWYFVGNVLDDSTPAIGLKAGTYYILMTRYIPWRRDEKERDNRHSPAIYNFSVDYTKSSIWENESNGSLDSARKISTNQPYYGSICHYDDVDWYKVTIPDGNETLIVFNHPDIRSSDAYWIVSMFNEDGVTQVGSWEVLGNQNRDIDVQLSGTYYIKITRNISWYERENRYNTSTYNFQVKNVPCVPTSIRAQALSLSSIKISWKEVSGATGYQVWRSESANGTYSCIATLSGTSKTNSSLTAGKTYYYKVRAYKDQNGKRLYSGYTSVVYATPNLAAPTNVTAKAASPTTVNIGWTPASGTQYRIRLLFLNT